eukprot:PhM_4_TR15123/c0_g1_i1/m.22522/K06898/K06898; uncharacterized protein
MFDEVRSASEILTLTESEIARFLSDPKEDPKKTLKDVSEARIEALHDAQALKMGCVTAIRGNGKDAETLVRIVGQKLKASSDKCAMITKVTPEKAEKLMPMLFRECLTKNLSIPHFDNASSMVTVCQKCKHVHKTPEGDIDNEDLDPFPGHGDERHRGVVGIFTAGAADTVIANECAMVLRMNGASVRMHNRWSVQRVTQDFCVPDVFEDCDVVIAIAGGEGTFPNIVGGLTTRPVIGIPTAMTNAMEGASGQEVLYVMMNNCVPGIAVTNVNDGFNGAMQALSILRQKYRRTSEYRSLPVESCNHLCTEYLLRAREEKHSPNQAWNELQNIRRLCIEQTTKIRAGVPNILGGQKPPTQVVEELRGLYDAHGQSTLVYATRVSVDVFNEMEKSWGEDVPKLQLDPDSRICWVAPANQDQRPVRGVIGVLSAGTADVPITAEAVRILELNGMKVIRIFDIGVNKIGRSMAHLNKLQEMDVVIVAAGMEGTLPGFIASFTDLPVIAIPTHIGYGTSQGGLSALWAMISASSVGMVVVNIDNGFGAAMYALSVCRTLLGNGVSTDSMCAKPSLA